jgi:hypothetical protein
MSLIDHLGLIISPQATPEEGGLIMRGPSGGWTTIPVGIPGDLFRLDPETGLPGWTGSVSGAELASNKDTPSGYAGLDSGGKLKLTEFPSTAVVTGRPFTGTLLAGEGGLRGDLNTYGMNIPAGQFIDLETGRWVGSTSTPDTSPRPLILAMRNINLNDTQIGNYGDDGGLYAASILGFAWGDLNNQVQTVGVHGEAYTLGTSAGTWSQPDACGVYGAGMSVSTSIGVGMGAFFRGAVQSPNGYADGIQTEVMNLSGVDHSVNANDFPTTAGIWLWADGGKRCAEGIALGNPFDSQFDVGLHFNGQVGSNATVGPTVSADIQSDSHAATSIKINGEHTDAIIIGASAGGMQILGAGKGIKFTSPNGSVQRTLTIDNSGNAVWT